MKYISIPYDLAIAIEEALDSRSDIVDGDEDGPYPNWAMRLLNELEPIIRAEEEWWL